MRSQGSTPSTRRWISDRRSWISRGAHRTSTTCLHNSKPPPRTAPTLSSWLRPSKIIWDSREAQAILKRTTTKQRPTPSMNPTRSVPTAQSSGLTPIAELKWSMILKKNKALLRMTRSKSHRACRRSSIATKSCQATTTSQTWIFKQTILKVTMTSATCLNSSTSKSRLKAKRRLTLLATTTIIHRLLSKAQIHLKKSHMPAFTTIRTNKSAMPTSGQTRIGLQRWRRSKVSLTRTTPTSSNASSLPRRTLYYRQPTTRNRRLPTSKSTLSQIKTLLAWARPSWTQTIF